MEFGHTLARIIFMLKPNNAAIPEVRSEKAGERACGAFETEATQAL